MQACAQLLLARGLAVVHLRGTTSCAASCSAFTAAGFSRGMTREATQASLTASEGLSKAQQAATAEEPCANSQEPQAIGAASVPGHATALPAPPPQWHKRGAWIDPSHIEKRMFVDEPEKPGAASSNKEPETEVSKSVAARIRFRGGPITVAEYMREVLYHPEGGFYAARGDTAIGSSGHFITSPEISVLFGEVMAAWVLQHYKDILGSPARVAYIELGPGNGTLANQILTALTMMPGGSALLSAMRLHMVEVSPGLRVAQAKALHCSSTTTVAEVAEKETSNPQSQAHKSSAPPKPPQPQLLRPSALSVKRSGKEPAGATSCPFFTPPTSAVQQDPQATLQPSNFSEEVIKMAAWELENIPGENIPGEGGSGGQGAQAGAAGDEGDRNAHGEKKEPSKTVPDALLRGKCDMTGGDIFWHAKLDEVPQDMPCIVMAHEFLDALPVHVFRHDDQRGWLEVLVDEEPDPENPKRLRFVLSPGPTKAVQHIMGRRHRVLRGDKEKQPHLPPLMPPLSTPLSPEPPVAALSTTPLNNPSDTHNNHNSPSSSVAKPASGMVSDATQATSCKTTETTAAPPVATPPQRNKPLSELTKAELHAQVQSVTDQILKHNRQQQQLQQAQQSSSRLPPAHEPTSQPPPPAGACANPPGPPSDATTQHPPPPTNHVRWQGGALPGLHALEVGAEAMAVAEAIALRIEACGGFALVIDYGKDSPYDSSLNAIRNHQPVHPLHEPGSSDLTTWVDFSALRQAVDESLTRVSMHGPLAQGHFCLANGMEQRVDSLLQKKGRTQAEVDALEDGFARLVAGTQHHPQGMGLSYKVMALTSSSVKAPFPFSLDFSQFQGD